MFENKKIRNISPYTLSTPEAWSFNLDDDVLKLDWNEATIKPSPKVLAKITKVLNDGKLNWYPNINNTELINKLQNIIAYRVVCSSGIKLLLLLLFQVIHLFGFLLSSNSK